MIELAATQSNAKISGSTASFMGWPTHKFKNIGKNGMAKQMHVALSAENTNVARRNVDLSQSWFVDRAAASGRIKPPPEVTAATNALAMLIAIEYAANAERLKKPATTNLSI